MRSFEADKIMNRENEREINKTTELEYEKEIEAFGNVNLSENRKGRLLSTLRLMNEDTFGFERIAQRVTDIPYEAILSEKE